MYNFGKGLPILSKYLHIFNYNIDNTDLEGSNKRQSAYHSRPKQWENIATTFFD
jgi:hypothetical protein